MTDQTFTPTEENHSALGPTFEQRVVGFFALLVLVVSIYFVFIAPHLNRAPVEGVQAAVRRGATIRGAGAATSKFQGEPGSPTVARLEKFQLELDYLFKGQLAVKGKQPQPRSLADPQTEEEMFYREVLYLLRQATFLLAIILATLHCSCVGLPALWRRIYPRTAHARLEAIERRPLR